MKKIVSVLIVAILMLTVTAFAQIVQPSEDFWYLDEANVLDDAVKGEIFFANQSLYDACGAEIVVVTIPTSGDMTLDDYAYELFNSWGIGSADTKRGFLLILAIDDDDWYYVIGTGLEKELESGTAGEILDKTLEPHFAKKEYSEGVQSGFEGLLEYISKAYNANVTAEGAITDYNEYVAQSNTDVGSNEIVTATRQEEPARNERTRSDASGYSAGTIGIVIVLVLIIFLFSAMKTTRRRRRMMPPPPVGGPDMPLPHHRHHTFFGGPRPMGGGMHHSSFDGGSHRSSFGGSSRSSGFGGARRSSGGSRSSGFGGARRSGGGSSRGAGGGRGRR